MNSINYSVWPELSIAYGKHDYVKMKRMYYSSLFLSVASIYIDINIFYLLQGRFIYVFSFGQIMKLNFRLFIDVLLLALFFTNNFLVYCGSCLAA